ncbi:DEAD/DEAH box helicase [Desertibacillus haloalkaliphilus]|uniref:DEAD/DEAH box helicase n=1 Tax=Desertibacillus haloalkaliphilus TaxID=1328930 RepID=UPI001C26A9DB|nr:DEAD/DEAH box helicase [Desertibacillus haloalkaliphilus]MBU8908361.1 DEAD/DEAH box helicase [Desertibacillus haloalkaliphilus]
MYNKHNPNKIILHGGWLDQEEQFFIWGERKQHKKYQEIVNFQYPFLYPPSELKLALFKYHSDSFYGTFIESKKALLQAPLVERMFYSHAGNTPVYHADRSNTSHLFPVEGISLSLEDLPEAIETMKSWLNDEEWLIGDDLRYWLLFFSQIQTEIISGEVILATNGRWQLTNMNIESWEMCIPPASVALKAEQYQLQPTNTNPSVTYSLKDFANEVADRLIKQLLLNNNEFRRALAQLSEESPSIQDWLRSVEEGETKQLQMNETTLQEHLGIIPSSPFKTGIAIDDPETEDEPWKLVLFVQDRNDPSLIVSMKDLHEGLHPWRENPISKLKHDIQQGANKVPLIKQLSPTNFEMELTSEDVYSFLIEDSPLLEDIGFTIFVPSWWNDERQQLSIQLAVKDKQTEKQASVDPIMNWQSLTEFDYTVSIGDAKLSEQEFDTLVHTKQPIVNIRGKWVVWDPTQAEKLKDTLEQQKSEAITHFDAWQLQLADEDVQLDEELTVDVDIHWDEKLQKLLEEVRSKKIPLTTPPETLTGTLRPYQQEGYSWLLHMRKLGFGACLADDMGLGKSIQTIAYLVKVLETQQLEGAVHLPFLLICPTSLIGNWTNELEQFAPHLRIYVHHGANRAGETELRNLVEDYDLIITSYALAVRDEDVWATITWNGLLLDEAQQIKNIETKQRRSIKKINAYHRIALTGTPIENRLKELWSIIDFLNHRYLNSYQHFQQTFIKEIEGRNQNDQRLKQLQQLISPFLLRRSKSDQHLNLQLPSKQEQTHRVGLTLEQASLYQAVVNDLLEKVDTVSEMERRALILSSLTKLKQICNHPVHFLKDGGRLEHRSEKWDLLEELVTQITDNDEKTLIFTQYKEMGELIQKGLSNKLGFPVPFLHGSIQRNKREEMIKRFKQDQAISTFILSLKAGGVGLNLTAANHVIHYDRWWNPAVENQATDRAYRIGQTQNVTVHKMVTSGTLEEKIDRMIERKQQLSDQILLSSENQLTELSNDDLKSLLELRKS